jgi:hypothetical protein
MNLNESECERVRERGDEGKPESVEVGDRWKQSFRKSEPGDREREEVLESVVEVLCLASISPHLMSE